VDLELNWTIADQFAIEFHGNIPIARYAQVSGLKIFNLGDTNVRAEDNILQILDDLEITEPCENNNIN
jgi:hypothetical protein